MIWALIACAAFALASFVLSVELVGERARRRALEEHLLRAREERDGAFALLSDRHLPRSTVR